jgi:DNA-binding HxlR family transcriptional regulator
MVEAVLGCKWTVQLLAEIASGHVRPGRLRRAVTGISTKVMNERLAKLTGFGVLERRVLSSKPLHVEYHLTAKGRQLAELIDDIQRFCRRWDGPGPATTPRRPYAILRPAAKLARSSRSPRSRVAVSS